MAECCTLPFFLKSKTMNFSTLAKNYIHYRLRAKDEYSIHSPFMFDFFTKGLKTKFPKQAYRKLKKDWKAFECKTSDLHLNLKHKNNLFICRIAAYFAPKQIHIISDNCNNLALYLSVTLPQSKISFFTQNAENISAIKQATSEIGSANTEIHNAKNSERLLEYLNESPKADFVIIDCRKDVYDLQNTMEQIVARCSENAVIILSNAFYKPAIEEQWEWFLRNNQIKVTADFFLCKVAFLTQDPVKKQHYILRTK
ncbi:MAG: hypothetical protein UIQ67_05990 [Bacteroidales bacterium]|nr:hypothetical protein [Bacteroidales bacterium]